MQVDAVSVKVHELHKCLSRVVELKFTTAFQSAEADFTQFAEVADAGSSANVLTVLTQMLAFQPLVKVPLLKLFGKSMAEDCIVSYL